MKKLFLLSVLLPVMAFSQGSQPMSSAADDTMKKSAENFLNTFYEYYQNKEWEKVLTLLCDDGIYFTETESTALPVYYKLVADYADKLDYSLKIKFKSVQTQIIGQCAAFLTVKVLADYKDKNGTKISEYIRMFLLESTEGSWKIKSIYTYDIDPFIFSEPIDKKWQGGITSSNYQSITATGLLYAFTNFLLTECKNSSVDVSLLGKKYAADWAKGIIDGGMKSFEHYIETLTWYIQAESIYMEVLERSDTTFKVKYQPYNPGASKATFDQELTGFFSSYFSELSSYFGGESTLVTEGKYWILTVNKQ